LGYKLGTQFTHYHQVVDYYKYLAQVASDRILLQEYGKTYEQRPMILATLTSVDNMQRLEEIRQAHLPTIEKKPAGTSATNAIVWLSYNVHGNESAGTEASMQT